MMGSSLDHSSLEALAISPRKGEVGSKSRVEAEFARTRAITARARTLRRNLTEAERKLWSRLRGAQLEGASFRRQHPIGGYYLDFWCPAARLAIEVDGGQHGFAGHAAHDARRTAALNANGIEVLRFWNIDVLTNLDGVLVVIAARLRARSSTPTLSLPLSGGGDGGAALDQEPDKR
jgi:very-short-patch-repair endonuclease